MKTEKITGALFILAITAKFFNIPGANLGIILTLLVTGGLYFPLAFYFFSDKGIKNQNVPLSIIGGMFLGIIVVGIMFKLLFWPGAFAELAAGVCLSLVLLVLLFYFSSKNTEHLKVYYKNYLTRTIFWLSIGIILLLTPNSTLIEIQHRDNPELARLKIQAYDNPGNLEYKQALDDYFMKSDSIYTPGKR